MRSLFIAALLSMAPLCSAFAEDGQKTCPTPGTAITIDIGGTLVVGSSSGLLCRFLDIKGKDQARWGLVLDANDDAVMAEGKDAIPKLWPLAVGKTVHFVRHRGTSNWDEDYTVDRKETLAIAGTPHETFVVIRKIVGDLHARGGQYRANLAFYLDTKLGYIVKFTHHEDCGRCTPSNARDWVATSITPP